MVRTKKLLLQGTPSTGSPRKYSGTMDDYVSTPADLRGAGSAANMAPASPGAESAGISSEDGDKGGALHLIRQELTRISANMLTKADSSGMLQEFRAAVREEITTLRTGLSAVEVRVDALETEAQASRSQHRAAEIAATRQGNLLLTLRRQVEDLENRSRRQNIRIRGLPEPDTSPLPDTARALFKHILGHNCPEEIQFDRIHRALGPPRQDGKPRDVLCCLHAYSLKEALMSATRGMDKIMFQGLEVALFQDLSGLTLDARRALRPITAALREKHVPYRWGFPFSLQIKHGNTWLHIRWPDDVAPTLRTLRFPHIRIRNWLLETPLAPGGRQRSRSPQLDQRREREPPARMMGGPAGAEE
ncbi:Hypothetical predicted protein [Pelobates cultripes]|uniref:Uncharacterized protein n=1 Tax=Pelobates cultripes TaxID=61616 RepID=A0AAD1W683_PELCU|nr:Hypothetical predicted protein [Pelobates cultripes]